MLRKVFVYFLLGGIFFSCETLQQVANQVSGTDLGTLAGNTSYSNAAGLKEALLVGISNSVSSLSKENGYFSNEALKILMPKDAAPIIDHIKMIPGGQRLVNDVVLRLNRAAEDASAEAKPIFVDAIKKMTFADATSILFGEKTAATAYLRKNTYNKLSIAFEPKVQSSLNKKLVGSLSTTDSWLALTSAYNKVANSLMGKAASLRPVNTNLSDYVTEQSLNGLFISMGKEEMNIRENPKARVNAILQKVFGQLDRK